MDQRGGSIKILAVNGSWTPRTCSKNGLFNTLYYLNAYLGYGIEPASGMTLDAAASAGYVGDSISASGDPGFHEYTLTLTGSYALTDQLGISATVGYTDSLDKDVLPDQEVDLFGGGGISYSF